MGPFGVGPKYKKLAHNAGFLHSTWVRRLDFGVVRPVALDYMSMSREHRLVK